VTPKLSIQTSWAGKPSFSRERSGVAIVLYLLLALVGGAMIPFQAGINAQLAQLVHGPIRAALVSFLVGTIVLLVVAAAMPRPLPAVSRLAHAPWWVWIGGLLGAFYVAMSVIVAPRIGAAALVGAAVAGQLAAALLIDQFGWVGFPVQHVSAGRVAGVAFLFVGVLLVRVF
jgi:transporter family-2 protein